MPKIKTRRSAFKRFKITKTGKVFYKKAFKSHLLEHKSAARKRRLTKKVALSRADLGRVEKMLPYR